MAQSTISQHLKELKNAGLIEGDACRRVPTHSNAAGVILVVQVLVAKCLPLGTAIAFMMGVIGLSLPETMLLKKVMNWKLIAIYFGTIAFFMIVSGYLFNVIL